MAGDRASIFDSGDTDALDISTFAPKAGPARAAPSAAEVKAVSAEAKFPSRQAAKPQPAETVAKRPRRQHRTGRNVQFNVKVSQETIDTFYALSDQQGWVLGETLEHALAALQKDIAAKR